MISLSLYNMLVTNNKAQKYLVYCVHIFYQIIAIKHRNGIIRELYYYYINKNEWIVLLRMLEPFFAITTNISSL